MTERREERGRTWNVGVGGARRFHVVYVGLPKTGSTTLAEIFGRWRSGHEYRFEAVAERLAAGAPPAELAAFLRARDEEAALEMDVATFHHFYADLLPSLFPSARFLFFVRAPRAWLDSCLNMMVRNRLRYGAAQVPAWQVRLGRLMFGAYEPDAFASPAALAGALPELVDRYLTFWSSRTAAVLSAVPADRRLVLPTAAITGSFDRLAAFAGVPVTSLDPAAHHRNRGTDKVDLLATLDSRTLDERLAAAVSAVPSEVRGLLAPS